MREWPQFEGTPSAPIEKASEYDVVLISTAHDNINYEQLVKDAKLVIDTRNAAPAAPNVYKA